MRLGKVPSRGRQLDLDLKTDAGENMLSEQLAAEYDEEAVARQVAAEAEGFYRSGKMHCAESVLAAVKNRFAPEMSYDVVRLAAGFGGGSGAGCICGAVSGGTMALGLVVEDNRKAVAALTLELQEWFKQEYGATCCKILTAHGKSGCVGLTASVAGKIAELLLEKGCRPGK
jgi:C_GCAxxG_C_C family probable redox protein